MDEQVTLRECLETLIDNKESYGQKGLDMQIYFVAQMFHFTYKDVVRQMKKLEREKKKIRESEE